MSLFSNLRKRDILPSYKLDDIGEEYGGVKKLDLEAAGYTIKTVNIENFKTFLAYNIQDVYVQYCIEENQEDFDKYVMFASNTRLSKGVNVSYTIKNELMLDFFNNDEIIGNSIRYNIDEPLEGAIVARPELIENLGEKIFNRGSYIYNNSIDLDASSEYPSVMITFNISKSSIYGRIIEVDTPNGEYISKGTDIIRQIETIDQSIFDLSKEYLDLPTPDEIIHDIEVSIKRK
jgi:DNA polymerase elongation subunit (family B)